MHAWMFDTTAATAFFATTVPGKQRRNVSEAGTAATAAAAAAAPPSAAAAGEKLFVGLWVILLGYGRLVGKKRGGGFNNAIQKASGYDSKGTQASTGLQCNV